MRQARRARTAPLLVAGGALALTAYGLFALQRDLESDHLRARERARTTVRLAADSLARELDRLAADLGARAPDPGSLSALDSFATERPFVELAFALGPSGRVLHPSDPAASSGEEPPASETVRVGALLDEAAFREFARNDLAGASKALEDSERAATHPRTRASVALARAAYDRRRGDREGALRRLGLLLEEESEPPRSRALARLSRIRLLAEGGDGATALEEARVLLDDLEVRDDPEGVGFLAEIEEAGVLGGEEARARGERFRRTARRHDLRARLATGGNELVGAGSIVPLGDAVAVLAPSTPGGRCGLLLSPEGFLASALPEASAVARVEGLPIRASPAAGGFSESAEVPGTAGLLRVGLPPGFEPAAATTGPRPFLLAALLLLLGGTIVGAAVFTARAARREVESARAKSEFLAAVTHELKTPLASIRLYGEMLEDGKGTEPTKRREWVATIRRESERLSALVDRVLALARRERDASLATTVVLPAADLLRTAAETFRPVAERGGTPFEVRIDDEATRVRVDASGLVQALLDLLENAVKHGGEGGGVLLRGSRRGTAYRIEVADRGPGIPAEEAERVFGMFARGSEAVAEERPGLGVGLALARRIVEANGGTLSYEVREGGGSVFAVALPVTES
jgi:signal transduction histidine kinase